MKTSNFRITQLPSGFWCVWHNGSWLDASLPTEAAAQALVKSLAAKKH